MLKGGLTFLSAFHSPELGHWWQTTFPCPLVKSLKPRYGGPLSLLVLCFAVPYVLTVSVDDTYYIDIQEGYHLPSFLTTYCEPASMQRISTVDDLQSSIGDFDSERQDTNSTLSAVASFIAEEPRSEQFVNHILVQTLQELDAKYHQFGRRHGHLAPYSLVFDEFGDVKLREPDCLYLESSPQSQQLDVFDMSTLWLYFFTIAGIISIAIRGKHLLQYIEANKEDIINKAPLSSRVKKTLWPMIPGDQDQEHCWTVQRTLKEWHKYVDDECVDQSPPTTLDVPRDTSNKTLLPAAVSNMSDDDPQLQPCPEPRPVITAPTITDSGIECSYLEDDEAKVCLYHKADKKFTLRFNKGDHPVSVCNGVALNYLQDYVQSQGLPEGGIQFQLKHRQDCTIVSHDFIIEDHISIDIEMLRPPEINHQTIT